jgi:serine/threonine-protein kinase
MGTVHQVHDLRLDRTVAVKRLRADLAADPTARRRFEHEARAAASLNHPNVVTVLDVGTDDTGVPFLVLEWLPGPTLATELAHGPLPPERIRHLGLQLLDALSVAHASGTLHRDVKPSNILLTDGGDAKLADFGIAKSLDDLDLTTTGQLVGTIRYLAPERLYGQPASPASDLYSLGMVLREAVTGVAPFAAASAPAEIAYSVTHEDLPPLAESDLGSLATVVNRATAKEPADRYASAAAMSAALSGDGAADATGVVPATAPLATVATSAADATVADRTAILAGPPVATIAPKVSGLRDPRATRRAVRLAAAVLLAALVAAVALAFAARPNPTRPVTKVTVSSTTTTTLAPVTTTVTVPPTTVAPPHPPKDGPGHGPHKHGGPGEDSGD